MEPVQTLVLEGQHVRLEPLATAHVPALAAIAQQAPRERYRLTSVPSDLAMMSHYVADAVELAAAGMALPFAIRERAGGTVVGSTRFFAFELWSWPQPEVPSRPAGIPDALEIGYTWLAPEAQRTAINTEAKLLLLTHAFEAWAVHRVNLKTDVRNLQSRAAIERIGGRLDGILREAQPASDGGIRDTALYSMLRAEWPANKRRLIGRLDRAAT